MTETTRRRLLTALASAPVALQAAVGRAAPTATVDRTSPPAGSSLPQRTPGVLPETLAADEAYWARVGTLHARTEGITNLEHGYWGRMATPVLETYTDAIARVNRDGAWYARRGYAADAEAARARVAELIGADVDEVALTRNATEAIHALLRQYTRLAPGDAVLLADVDYPAFKRLMAWLGPARGVEVVTLELPPRADEDELFERYAEAFEAHPNLRLALVTHASNQHGLLLPVARIARLARERGIDVVCDAAQSLGLVDLKVEDLACDWVGFNLHKWIGAPLGLGALYMRRGTLGAVAPYPGETDGAQPSVQRRVHTGTWDFAAAVTIPAAVDFHDGLGGAFKEARLRHLRRLWTDAARGLPGLEVLGGRDEASWTGIASFRLPGRTTIEDARALQQRLLNEFGVFTVTRQGLASGACVRVTPQVYTARTEIERLVDALGVITS